MTNLAKLTFKEIVIKTKDAIFTGIKKALKLILKITLIITPVYFIVSLLRYFGILEIIANFFAPIMKVFGLPGNVALTLICANSINIYAGIATLEEITLTVKQITILGTMIGFSHSLPVETGIIKGLKIPIFIQIILRFGVAIIVGILMNLIWKV